MTLDLNGGVQRRWGSVKGWEREKWCFLGPRGNGTTVSWGWGPRAMPLLS